MATEGIVGFQTPPMNTMAQKFLPYNQKRFPAGCFSFLHVARLRIDGPDPQIFYGHGIVFWWLLDLIGQVTIRFAICDPRTFSILPRTKQIG